ncbi:hypothetical protein [Staphylococcus epidermidis]|uniref:hypothetical protein n=1 Tax=Staphylococcus epidermidis TaxID=1282 RepID=UPI00024E133F|nr:hypothetical protein [Staphylococcus epidermidis]EHR87243.1 hypothetical protein SEVCU118_1771 [Staphylococcus epidermidis VCU118]
MVKIKNKVTLKPKELIKYLLDFEEIEFALYIETEGGYNNLFKPKLKVENYITYNEEEETFTIEVEEEITEDTNIDKLVELVINDKDIPHTSLYYNTSINQMLSATRHRPQAYFMLNDDSTITRIWENGKLID